jgi:hypothetical protein
LAASSQATLLAARGIEVADAGFRDLDEARACRRHRRFVSPLACVRDLAVAAASVVKNLALALDALKFLDTREGADERSVVGARGVQKRDPAANPGLRGP